MNKIKSFNSKTFAKFKLVGILAEIASESLKNNEPQEKFIETLNSMKEEIDRRIKDCSGEDK